MAGARSRRTAIASAATLLAASSFAPAPPVHGVEGPETHVLPGASFTAVTADLNGDGSAEVVTLVTGSTGEPSAVEVWEFAANAWSRTASVSLDGAAPDSPSQIEMASLLTAHVDGTVRAFLVTALTDISAEFATTACCLEIEEVRTGAGGVGLVPRWSGEAGADIVRAVDLDADGTDEIVTELTIPAADPEEWSHATTVLGWAGSGFASILELEAPEDTYAVSIGDSDGVPGDEVLIGPSRAGELQRIVASGEDVRVENGRLPSESRSFDAWPVGAHAGRIVLESPMGSLVVRWPAGGDPVIVDRIGGSASFVAAMVGAGDESLILSASATSGVPRSSSMAVYDLGGRRLGEIEGTALPEAFSELIRDWSTGTLSLNRFSYPYSGPLPGGLDGRPAYVVEGTLLQVGGPEGFESRTISPLIGSVPVGRAGPDDAWMLMTNGFFGPGPTGGAYLFPYGGQPDGLGHLALVPMEEVLAARPSASVAVEASGAVPMPSTGQLLAPGDGFRAVVTAPASTVVIVRDGRLTEEHLVADEPLVVDIRPRRNAPDDRNLDFERTFVVMLASGHVSVTRWEGTFVREKPTVTASGATRTFVLSSTVTGHVDGATSVTVDGRAAELTDAGAFSVDVDAPIWPREVVVVARDLLGNEATSRLDVVGLVDYRGLPWALILGCATVVAAFVLFVRTPTLRRGSAPSWSDDASLEEID